jgi:hypothetical protein
MMHGGNLKLKVLEWSLYTHLYTVFVMHYFHTLHPISSHTMWNGKNKSVVQYMCVGRYLHTYIMCTEKFEALLEY